MDNVELWSTQEKSSENTLGASVSPWAALHPHHGAFAIASKTGVHHAEDESTTVMI